MHHALPHFFGRRWKEKNDSLYGMESELPARHRRAAHSAARHAHAGRDGARRRDAVHALYAGGLLVRGQKQGLFSHAPVLHRHGGQPDAEDHVLHPAALGARPLVRDRRVRPRGRDGLLLPLGPHAERRRRLRRDVLHHEKALGARGVHGAGAAHSLFAAVSRRSHAARRRRIVPDRLAAGAGVLSSARGDRPPRRGARTHLAHPARTGGAVPALCASRPRGRERRRGQF